MKGKVVGLVAPESPGTKGKGKTAGSESVQRETGRWVLLPVSKHLAHVNFVASKNDHVWTARTWLIVSQQHGPIIVPAFYPSKACCRSTRWLQFK